MTNLGKSWELCIGWIRRRCQRLVSLPEAPHRIALGFCVGFFLGFTPFFGFKTVLAIAIAWVLRGNKIAALIGLNLHDIVLPLLPALFKIEYIVGNWVLGRTDAPPSILQHLREVRFSDALHGELLSTLGIPLIVGSFVLGLPATVAVYFAIHHFVETHKQAALLEEVDFPWAEGDQPTVRDPLHRPLHLSTDSKRQPSNDTGAGSSR
ncbi:DUF2062 domain-containing protein [Candidatus Methylacidithermus pantelleriae]|uniref:DUF2062 domain-containing protein n=1 Tax=Candidatus Methylacidithermus pantelleriae TaxID=2744239 RepID=A0A8J2BVM2_9BACT|nr:DUF2062 domain-containing protein [Candidatus Methylacidithermus pantelleriae]CAF0704450.1 membrane hypothetical protein [Candidatus Methylacidithermus pantelleriae]